MGACGRAGFDPNGGSELRLQGQHGAWAEVGGAGAAAGDHPGYGSQNEAPAAGGGAPASYAAAAAAAFGEVAGGDAGGDAAMDLGWLSAEQLAEMGLTCREDVVKSTSMVGGNKGMDGGMFSAYFFNPGAETERGWCINNRE